jgi:hypothetical protein
MLPAMSPWTLLIVVLLAVFVSGCSVVRSATEPPRLTALAAVRYGLQVDQTIRTRYPDGKLSIVGASSPNFPDRSGTASEWLLGVSDPATGTLYQFSVTSGHVGQVAAGSDFLHADRPLIADLSRGTNIADVMDSDKAVQVTDTLGGAEYRKRTGAEVLSISMSGFDGRRLEWEVFYSKQFTEHQATISIDARTGELIRVNSQDFIVSKP